MDPATLKIALALAQTAARSKTFRWVVVVGLLLSLMSTFGTIYGTMVGTAQLANSFRIQQAAAAICATPTGTQPVAADPAVPTVPKGTIVWPVPGHVTTTYPGHDGVDINRYPEDFGDPIRAAAAGTVQYVGTGHGYGVAIFIKTDIGPVNIYGHTSQTHVKAGQHVDAGQLIGNVGNTGHSTGPHLHFGVVPGLSYKASMDFLRGAVTLNDKGPNAPPPTNAPDIAKTPKSDRWSADQLAIARTIIAVGKAHNIPEKGWVIAIATGLVESGLLNIHYGDRDSQGWAQQRPSAGWGTVAEVTDPALAAEAFYGVAKHTNNRGLVDVYNWENRPVGEVAQSIQISAFPDRYAQREQEARDIVALLSGTPAAVDPDKCGGSGNLTGDLQAVAVLNPQGSGNWQNAVRSGQYWYVSHAYQNDQAQIFHRLDKAGQELDHMQAVGFKHAISFAAVGSTIYATDGTGRVVTFPYRAGATIHAGKATPWHGYISMDPSGQNLVISNGNRYQAYSSADNKKIGVQVRAEDGGVRQGFSISGTTIYVLWGATNSRAHIDAYSALTGKKIGTRDITQLAAAESGPHREPEGMYGSMVGIKSNVGEKRRLRVYTFATASNDGEAPELTGTAPPAYPLLPNHLGPNAERLRKIVTDEFGIKVTPYDCYVPRPSGATDDSYHYSGHACDVMTYSNMKLGYKISRWARTNAKALGVTQVIFNRQIWTLQRDSEGWRNYTQPNPHTDHVHLSVDRSR